MSSLAELYDVALLDLDGTVYLGGVVIEHVAESLTAAKELGMVSIFVTNNASRPPEVVAESLRGMAIEAAADDVVTSPQAAVEMLTDSHPAGSAVLVVGAPYLREVVAAAGLVPVALAADQPVAVVQGHSPETGWPQLAEASLALQAGANWVACNTDSTLPTDRGLLPGNGAMVAALIAATGQRPRVAGKPGKPLLDTAIQRTSAQRPLVVGDRLDTDIEAGFHAGLPSLLTLTGVSTASDLLAATKEQRPTHVSFDLRGLVDAERVAVLPGQQDTAGTTTAVGLPVSIDPAGTLLVADPAETGGVVSDGVALQTLVTLAAAAWATIDPVRVSATGPTAATVLARLGLAAP